MGTEPLDKTSPDAAGTNSSPIEFPSESIIDGEIAKYKNFEIIIEDDRNFILKHKEDLEPAIQITIREEADGV